MTSAGGRKPIATAFRFRKLVCGAGGAAAGGGSTAIPPELPATYFPEAYAFAADDSSDWAMPFTLDGLFKKSWKILNSPWPTVPPNDAGCRSERSNRKTEAFPIAVAVLRVIASGYALAGTVFAGAE